MHPSILLDLLRHGYLTKEQLSISEIEAVQVLMIQRAIEGYIPTTEPVITVVTKEPPKDIPHGKLIGKWGGKLAHRKRRKVA